MNFDDKQFERMTPNDISAIVDNPDELFEHGQCTVSGGNRWNRNLIVRHRQGKRVREISYGEVLGPHSFVVVADGYLEQSGWYLGNASYTPSRLSGLLPHRVHGILYTEKTDRSFDGLL